VRGAQRHHDDFILVAARPACTAALLEDPDDLERDIIDLERCADRIHTCFFEEALGDAAADHRDPGAAVDVGLRDKVADDHRTVTDYSVGGRHAGH